MPEQSAFMTWLYTYANVIQFFAQLAFYLIIAGAAVVAVCAWTKYASVARKVLYLQNPAIWVYDHKEEIATVRQDLEKQKQERRDKVRDHVAASKAEALKKEQAKAAAEKKDDKK